MIETDGASVEEVEVGAPGVEKFILVEHAQEYVVFFMGFLAGFDG